jgi:TIR domain
VIDRGGYQPIIQAWDFRPGDNFVLRMQEAMADSDLTIAALSEHYLKGEFTQPEWAAAFARDPTGKNRKLIPVRVAKCHLPPILSEIIYIDLVGRAEQDAERALLDGLKPSGKPAQAPPFPGKQAEPSISTAPFPPNIGKLHGVPDLSPHYLPREEDLAGLKQKLLTEGSPLGITGQSSARYHGPNAAEGHLRCCEKQVIYATHADFQCFAGSSRSSQRASESVTRKSVRQRVRTHYELVKIFEW